MLRQKHWKTGWVDLNIWCLPFQIHPARTQTRTQTQNRMQRPNAGCREPLSLCSPGPVIFLPWLGAAITAKPSSTGQPNPIAKPAVCSNRLSAWLLWKHLRPHLFFPMKQKRTLQKTGYGSRKTTSRLWKWKCPWEPPLPSLITVPLSILPCRPALIKLSRPQMILICLPV